MKLWHTAAQSLTRRGPPHSRTDCMLLLLPQEAGSHKIAVRPERRRHYAQELKSAASLALNILSGCVCGGGGPTFCILPLCAGVWGWVGGGGGLAPHQCTCTTAMSMRPSPSHALPPPHPSLLPALPRTHPCPSPALPPPPCFQLSLSAWGSRARASPGGLWRMAEAE